MDNPPPSLGRPTDPGGIQIAYTEKRDGKVMDQVNTEASSSKLVGKKRPTLETKMILKRLKKVKKMAAKAADMMAELSNSRAEMGELEAAAEEMEREVKLEKEKRDGCLAEMLLMSILVEILAPASDD